MNYREIEGDLISLALQGEFDVITHGCNCFCKMEAGIAPLMAKEFGCDSFKMEGEDFIGDINKLGQIEWEYVFQEQTKFGGAKWVSYPDEESFMTGRKLAVVNSYTQYRYGKNHTDGDDRPIDYEALALCLRKINHEFKGKHIGLPKIGCGLAGGIWDKNELSDKEFMDLPLNFRDVKTIIKKELKDCDVTIVLFKK